MLGLLNVSSGLLDCAQWISSREKVRGSLPCRSPAMDGLSPGSDRNLQLTISSMVCTWNVLVINFGTAFLVVKNLQPSKLRCHEKVGIPLPTNLSITRIKPPPHSTDHQAGCSSQKDTCRDTLQPQGNASAWRRASIQPAELPKRTQLPGDAFAVSIPVISLFLPAPWEQSCPVLASDSCHSDHTSSCAKQASQLTELLCGV